MSYGIGTFGSEDPNDRKFRKYSDRELIRALVGYILRYKRDFTIVMTTLLVTASIGVIGPYLFGYAINDIISKNYDGVLILVGLFLVISFIGYYSEGKRLYHIQLLGQNVIYDMREDAFGRLQELSPSYYSKRETGRIMSYITNDVDALSDFVTFQFPAVLSGGVLIISIVIIMFVVNVNLSLVSLAVLPPLILLTYAMQGRIQQSFVETRKKIAVVTAKLQEGISGVRVTQSLAKEDRVNESFDYANSANLEANLRANRLTSLFNSLIIIIQAGGIALVLWYGAMEVLKGQISVGLLFSFLLYVNAFFNPIIQLTAFYNSYQSAVTGFDRVLQVLNSDVSVKQKDSPAVMEASHFMEIRFENVTFGYEEGQQVLRNLSFQVEKNKVLAIVGPTGAGKSSIVNLIFRFYDVQGGRVTINGRDVRDLSFSDLRRKMSLIPQDPFLFSGTIMDNIRYGKPDATDEQVYDVSRKLGLDSFVRALPSGYATVISEGATNLSMGQKQLVCFARAFLPDPELVIMDEATSGVDPYTELQLQKALSSVLEGRTAIIIAHRLSTIRLADKIIVLTDGEIAEAGSFSELMENKDGAFARMYALQSQLVD